MYRTTKTKVKYVMIFGIICIAITLGLILYKNIEINQESADDANMSIAEQTNNEIEGINLKGTYNENGLKIQENNVKKDKAEINYYQISGLKNKVIQENINQELEKVSLNFYKENIDDLNKVINVSVKMLNTANFANVVSFETSYVAKIDDNANGFYQDSKVINYDLTTGEQITIDKLFTSNAPIEDILRKSAYYSLIKRNLEKNLAGNFVVANYGNIEDDIAMFIDQYKKGQIDKFYFSPKYIYIYYEGNIITVNMSQYADYIAIYNRYLTDESIFETSSVGLKNLYTLTERKSADYRYTNYEKENNYFIDINIDNNDGESNEVSQKIFENKRKEVETEIEKIKSVANRYPGNFYILNYYINITTTKDDTTQKSLIRCTKKGNSYEMVNRNFEEDIEPIIISYNRKDTEGEIPDYIYDFSGKLNIQPQETVQYYNPETGEEITK